MNIESITTIEKENIPLLEFNHQEVLMHPDQVAQKKELLYHAMIHGNTYHTKVKLIFESKQGIYQVETTVWAATDDFVLLKGGVFLPFTCILEVIF